uniref:heterogeneous nuclear ribonucleoprotein K isoform X2 n=1 Tax=Ciona intestinalis TaxID=7719 RepID=UPI000EF46A57|nr:heterogeneous nuclear ribonucleoprotein K isoform X2 [Ciona intestinalis]|eukprot:XP_026693772.1 heterogeneous nuclear ribonucleoprotein K isoform X2 [Ciona intestinalis]
MSEATDSSTNKRSHDDVRESGDSDVKRSRSSFQHDRFHQGGREPSDKIELRVLIPSHTAGAIIGKGGANIRDLRQEFNANVQVPDSHGFERIVSAVAKTIEDAANICGKVVEALNERMHHPEKVGCLRMLVHKSQAGTIIGLKGSRIKELREMTGANIKVNQECCPESTDRVCQVRGTADVVVKCVARILEHLQQAPPKGPIKNYDPNCFDDSYDYGGYANERGMDGPRGGRRGGRGGRGGFRSGGRFDRGGYGGMKRGGGRQNYGGDGGGFGGSRYSAPKSGRRLYGGYDEDGYQDYDDNFDPYQENLYNDSGDGQTGNGDQKTTQVTIPTSCAASVIGKTGQRIRQIREDSGAVIVIDEAGPGEEERVISITGNEEQTQNAQFLLQKNAEEPKDE